MSRVVVSRRPNRRVYHRLDDGSVFDSWCGAVTQGQKLDRDVAAELWLHPCHRCFPPEEEHER